MIIVALKGGLGNQMFQYALGRRLSIDRGSPLLLDLRAFTRDPLRSFSLSCFCIAARVATDADLANWPPQVGLTRHVRRLADTLTGRSTRVIVERKVSFDATVLNADSSAYFDGYWQSDRYFSAIADILRNEFKPRSVLSARFAQLSNELGQVKTISVHVRRGDYVTSPHTKVYHGTCEPGWYRRALRFLCERADVQRVFVFTDDPVWARENLRLEVEATVIDPAPPGSEYEDMLLMALCEHHIIANSSFSWWGAWLNSRPGKIVVAPARWFAGGPKDTQDIVPNDWYRI